MRVGDVADGVNHGQNHEAGSERNACVSNETASNIIDDDGARSGKNKAERAETLGRQLLHFVFVQFSSSRKWRCFYLVQTVSLLLAH